MLIEISLEQINIWSHSYVESNKVKELQLYYIEGANKWTNLEGTNKKLIIGRREWGGRENGEFLTKMYTFQIGEIAVKIYGTSGIP